VQVEEIGLSERDDQALIWDYFKPRHTHAWNMLVISWRKLDAVNEVDDTGTGFEAEYCWENFILRLWLYRTVIKTLTKLNVVKSDAYSVLEAFDRKFDSHGKNGLKALRDMLEHFDDYAAGKGRGPGKRERDLDPWRIVTKDRYERGVFLLERHKSYEAAINLRAEAKDVSNRFIELYRKTV
jgi:hypothetical protein